LYKTSKGMREMNYQDTQQFERATMPKLPTETFIGFMRCKPFGFYLVTNFKTIHYESIKILSDGM